MRETVDGFTREFLVRPAFDKRHDDPKKNYGVHNVEMHWTLIGPRGAVTLMWHTTGLDLPSVHHSRDPYFSQMFEAVKHSPTQLYEWSDAPSSEKCEYTGGKCWSDSGFGCAEAERDALIAEGEEGLWRELRALYDAWMEKEVAF